MLDVRWQLHFQVKRTVADVIHERCPPILQGEGGDAVVTGDVSIKGIAQDTESEIGEVLGVARMEFIDTPVLERFRKADVVYAPPREVL